MSKVQYVLKSINILNILLLALLIAAVYHSMNPAGTFKIPSHPVTQGKSKKVLPEQHAASPLPAPADYAVISERNLFHPERHIPVEKEEKKDEKQIATKPDLILSGTLIDGDMSIAYIEDKKSPYSTPGRGKRPRSVKKGDSIEGYILKEIEADRIILAKGEEKLVLRLDVRDKVRGGAGDQSLPSLPAGFSMTPASRTSAGKTVTPAMNTIIPDKTALPARGTSPMSIIPATPSPTPQASAPVPSPQSPTDPRDLTHNPLTPAIRNRLLNPWYRTRTFSSPTTPPSSPSK